jgi:hypothetical protein
MTAMAGGDGKSIDQPLFGSVQRADILQLIFFGEGRLIFLLSVCYRHAVSTLECWFWYSVSLRRHLRLVTIDIEPRYRWIVCRQVARHWAILTDNSKLLDAAPSLRQLCCIVGKTTRQQRAVLHVVPKIGDSSARTRRNLFIISLTLIVFSRQ